LAWTGGITAAMAPPSARSSCSGPDTIPQSPGACHPITTHAMPAGQQNWPAGMCFTGRPCYALSSPLVTARALCSAAVAGAGQ
jgi:hypothetical protein